MTTRRAPRPFTGRRLALMIGGMFAVVIAVNATMATLAVETFTGAVVDNGYVANQQFNHWIARGETEAAVGWSAKATAQHGQVLVEALDHGGRPLTSASVRLHLRHPLQVGDGRWLTLTETAPGHYVAAADVARGQWDMQIVLTRAGTTVHVRERLYARAG